MSFFDRIKTDIHFRVKTLLHGSIVVNAIYSVFLFVLSQIYSSKWFFAISIYYGLLFISRIVIFYQISPKRQLRSKILTMRACGYFLLLINLAVSTMMFILIRVSNNIKYHEIIVISLATYVFWSVGIAIASSIKEIKKNNHVYSCVRIISLISASVSLVTLTNTMLITFGENNVLLRNIIMPILCVVVAVFIIICAIFMIKKANFDLRTLSNEKERK